MGEGSGISKVASDESIPTTKRESSSVDDEGLGAAEFNVDDDDDDDNDGTILESVIPLTALIPFGRPPFDFGDVVVPLPSELPLFDIVGVII